MSSCHTATDRPAATLRATALSILVIILSNTILSEQQQQIPSPHLPDICTQSHKIGGWCRPRGVTRLCYWRDGRRYSTHSSESAALSTNSGPFHSTPLTLSYQYHAVLILVFTNYSTMLLCHRQAGQLTCKHVRKVLLEVV